MNMDAVSYYYSSSSSSSSSLSATHLIDQLECNASVADDHYRPRGLQPPHQLVDAGRVPDPDDPWVGQNQLRADTAADAELVIG